MNRIADVIPICPVCRLWGQGACKQHQPKKEKRNAQR